MRKTWIYSLFFANLIIILAIWWHFSGPLFSGNSAAVFLTFGRLAGLLLANFLLTQLMLAGRLSWIEQAFGH